MQDACKLTSFRRYLAAAITQNSWGGSGGGGRVYFLFIPREDCMCICMNFIKDTTMTIMEQNYVNTHRQPSCRLKLLIKFKAIKLHLLGSGK